MLLSKLIGAYIFQELDALSLIKHDYTLTILIYLLIFFAAKLKILSSRVDNKGLSYIFHL